MIVEWGNTRLKWRIKTGPTYPKLPAINILNLNAPVNTNYRSKHLPAS
jgi:hypothetical protein